MTWLRWLAFIAALAVLGWGGLLFCQWVAWVA